jgi:hypothetical protein
MMPFINELLNEKILNFLRDEAQYVAVSPEKEQSSEEVNTEETAGEKA